jgi:hypothetical protein
VEYAYNTHSIRIFFADKNDIGYEVQQRSAGRVQDTYHNKHITSTQLDIHQNDKHKPNRKYKRANQRCKCRVALSQTRGAAGNDKIKCGAK